MREIISSENTSPYLTIVLNSLPRLLALQNRCPVDTHYGCFDKNFWHFKVSDFPNAAAQMGSEVLARLWEWPIEGNPYYRNAHIGQWAKHGLLYLVQIQKKGGAFDEWYPNERGWAGPTGYVLHSLVSGYKILSKQNQWSKEEELRIKKAICKAAKHLGRRDEGHILSNHFAVTMMALYDAWEIIQEDWILDAYTLVWKQLKKYLCYKEGWGLEYDGVDLGYNLAILSFLGRIHARNGDKDIETYCHESCKFLSYFCYPDRKFWGKDRF